MAVLSFKEGRFSRASSHAAEQTARKRSTVKDRGIGHLAEKSARHTDSHQLTVYPGPRRCAKWAVIKSPAGPPQTSEVSKTSEVCGGPAGLSLPAKSAGPRNQASAFRVMRRSPDRV